MFHHTSWSILRHSMHRCSVWTTHMRRCYRTLAGEAQERVRTGCDVSVCHQIKKPVLKRTRHEQHCVSQCSAIFHCNLPSLWNNNARPYSSKSESMFATDPKDAVGRKKVKRAEVADGAVNGRGRGRRKTEKRQIVEITDDMTVKQLAVAIGGNKDELVDLLYSNGFIPNKYYNAVLSRDTIKAVLHFMKMSYRFRPKPTVEVLVPQKKTNLDAVRRPPPDPSVLKARPPVVTVMGHVDHGKTTLLDTLRKTSVAAGEAGGITQHIGAFLVDLDSKHQITFLDTPGHAAFSTMRERGANVTDIVVLVVAAEDSVMEQTKESIRFAQNARVPIVVAINKCDKPNADPDLTKRDLLSYGIQLEEFGGDVQAVEISALKGTNIDALMEAIVTLAEVQEIRGDPSGFVEGVVIESRVDKGKGAIATLIIQRGILQRGAILVAGKCMCKVRAMFNEHEQRIQKAPPGTPVEVIGWKSVPSAGDVVLQVETDSRAKEVIRWREDQDNQVKIEEQAIEVQKQEATRERKHFETRSEREAHMMALTSSQRRKPRVQDKEITESDEPELNIVIKGDVDGSVEAILDALATYDAHEQCKLNILHYGVGGITAKDVEVAQTFSGVVVGFNVSPSMDALKVAQEADVPLMLHNIIYRLMDEIRDNCNSRLPPLKEEVVVGEATVLMPFQITVGSKKVPIAGCKVTKGSLSASGLCKLIRNNEILFTGPLASLKHKKDDVNSVKKDMECGLRFKKQVTYEIGDVIICYKEQMVPQKLQWNFGF